MASVHGNSSGISLSKPSTLVKAKKESFESERGAVWKNSATR